MRTLRNTLHDLEPGELRIVAERWGVDTELPAGTAASEALAAWMLQPANLAECLAGLTDGEAHVLAALRRHAGRMPLADAERRFGEWRRMGPARRDRIQPHRNPSGPLESLSYSGLIGRAFADAPAGPQEFVFLPSDLMPLLPALSAEPPALLPAAEPSLVLPAPPSAAEDCVTILAAFRRRGMRDLEQAARWCEPILPFLMQPEAARLLITLLLEVGAVSEAPHRPHAEQTGRFLQSLHDDPRRPLADWRSSKRWNDLSQVPSLSCETLDWPGDPLTTRQALLEILDGLPHGVWFELAALVQLIRNECPGFQRTAGEFDAWYLRHRQSGEFLRGYEHWDDVEGALIRYVVCGPLHWLGHVDLGCVAHGVSPDRFRRCTPLTPQRTTSAAQIDPEGVIRVPFGAPPAQRYQLARFCEWEARAPTGFIYRLTPSALRLAYGQGLRPPQVVTLLESASGQPLPAHLQRALLRTDAGTTSPRVEEQLVLHVPDAHQLKALLGSKSTARFLGDRVGKDGIVVRSGVWERLRAAAARMGILIDRPQARSVVRRRG
jgi:hypothetical protein